MPFLPPPKLYYDLARSPVEEYRQEAGAYHRLFRHHPQQVSSILELGCGGGNNAFYLKEHYTMTLVDVSPQMLAICAGINPECTCVHGDMRHVRVDRQFDAVFVHDAVSYITTVEDLQLVADTAANHCNPGGIVLMVPDFVEQTFREGVSHGGANGPDGRSMRYLEWISDPDPNDSTYIADFAYLFRTSDGSVHCEHDRHILGLFSSETWLRAFRLAGLDPRSVSFDYDGSGELDAVGIAGIRG
jgi:SAM-dependent methyltransferase